MSKRTYQQLSESERQAIALGLQQKQTISAIARALGRHKSTISREIERNAGGNGYISRFAQQRRDKRRIHSRPQPKLQRDGALFQFVRQQLKLHWSPQQIAGQLKTLQEMDAFGDAGYQGVDPGQGGTPVQGAQAAVWLCEGALPWFEEKHGADRHAVCPVQPVDGQAQFAGHGTGVCATGLMPTQSGNCLPREALE